jgi:ABC-type uncharacterized transport system involved in gliding motility auxiliary subunit
MLEEFAQYADGQLKLTVIDPLPFSEDEDRASEFGLQSINLGTASDPIYLGIAGSNSIGDEEIIAFLDPSKETFLEYDLAKLIYTLSRPDRPVIGLISGLPITAGFDPQTQQMRQPWLITSQVQQLFELRTLPLTTTEIEAEIDVLMVVHPKDLGDDTLYAIDQFILGGGRALLFVDPYSETDIGDANPQMAMMADRSSSLAKLLDAWGIAVDVEEVVGDDRFALTVTGLGNRPVRHLALLGVDDSGIDGEDVITAGLGSINFGFSGYIIAAEEASASIAPLVRSSEIAGTIPAANLGFMSDPDLLRDSFAPTGEEYVLAARIQGQLPSAFPDGPPPKPDADSSGASGTHRSQSEESVNVVLVADTDLLTDRLWAQVQNFFGQRLTTAFAGNADFVVNALDNLTGSGDLISIRGRAAYARPFTRVQDLRREAENRFRDTEQRLQQELRDTESRLSELQASREDSSVLILTPEQEAELERFQEQRLRIRKELRQVQRDLDQSIEDLGTWLKVINIGLMPVVISVFSLMLLFFRRRRRERS